MTSLPQIGVGLSEVEGRKLRRLKVRVLDGVMYR